MGRKRELIWKGVRFGVWSLLELVSPSLCPLCREKLFDFSPLCPVCLENFLVIGEACEFCGQPLFTGESRLTRCGNCRPVNPRADRTASLFFYDDALKEAIPLFKYRGHTRIGRVLARRMAESLDTYPEMAALDGIIPVPLHPARLRERGFNQSVILARAISRRFDLPLLSNLVKKTGNVHSQVGLSRSERKRMIKGSFAVAKGESVKNGRFLVVDDVLTTGATSSEICKVLKKSGAAYLWFYSLARRC
ncbi:MAG: phosphoribosyltransferase family protein [bacterium]